MATWVIWVRVWKVQFVISIFLNKWKHEKWQFLWFHFFELRKNGYHFYFLYSLRKAKLKNWKIKTNPCMNVQFHFSIFFRKMNKWKCAFFVNSIFLLLKKIPKICVFTDNNFPKKSKISATSVFCYSLRKGKLENWKIKTYPCMIVQFHFSNLKEKWLLK